MKAIGIKMVDLQPMNAREANDKGHRIGEYSFETEGYEVTYPDGYKSWCPKEVADTAYFPLSEDNDGTKILKEDVDNFITDVEVMTVGEKTTVVNAHTLTGFDTVRYSSCVDPKNYSEELGKEYAMEEVVNNLWAHLGFVLQWAKYGLNAKQKPVLPPHIQRVIDEYKQLDDRTTKLAKFIAESPIYQSLAEDEKEDMKEQLTSMYKYSNILASRLNRVGIDVTTL